MAGNAEVLSKHTRLALALAGDPKGRSGKDAVHLARDRNPVVLNKANLEEVSSLKFQVSSRRTQSSNLPASNLTLHTPLKPPYRVSRAYHAKQSQLGGSGKFEVSSVKWEGAVARDHPVPRRPVVRNKANLRRARMNGNCCLGKGLEDEMRVLHLRKTKPICRGGGGYFWQ